MKILIACEESQEVCKAFREKGHTAYSCDIKECSGGHPEWHIKDNVLNHLEGWDMIIAFPPCTYFSRIWRNNGIFKNLLTKQKNRDRIIPPTTENKENILPYNGCWRNSMR